MISLPDDLLARIDAEARRRSMSRSELLRAAARRTLGERDFADARAAVDRSRARFADVGPLDSAALIRAERDALDRRDRGRL